MANATINVPVTTFNAVGAGFCATGALTIASCNPSGRVSVDPNNSNNIIVTNPNGHGNGAIDLTFAVTGGTYTVVGLAIDNSGLSGNSPNFNLSSISSNTVQIKNHYNQGNGTTWKLYICVMNSSGQLGVIDPGIDNQDAA